MEFTVLMDEVELSTKEASRILCLFLAQNEKPDKPHVDLGFNTAQSAFEKIGILFRRKPNTIKNERDAFDYHTNSPRVGWKTSLKPSLKSVWAKYGHLSREELLQISLDILAHQREQNIFNKVAFLPDAKHGFRPPNHFGIAEFSNSRGDKKWYYMHVDQILECLEDYKKPVFQSTKIPKEYDEDNWRDELYKHHFSSDALQTLGSTQGLPVYDVLAKFIQVANDLPKTYKSCPIDVELLDKTIVRINNDMAKLSPFSSNAVVSNRVVAKTSGENIIFYGAPGTGKSTEIKKRISNSPKVVTVFHPDMQNSDFIGALKPAVNGENVTYQFSPGPFAKALLEAYNQPDQDVYLVIEELNRAPAMAVFGELFQLLDRKDNGESDYGVDFPSDEFQAWLNQRTNKDHAEIKLPSNFSIYASMNSADQGVYPLDTAFRRRWEQEYITIDWKKGLEDKLIIIKTDGSETKVPWKDLGKAINNELEEQYPEDRLLGQWWINKRDIENSDGLVPSKLLNYLWDDLLRHDEETKKKIFKPDIQRFGQLMHLNHGRVKKQIFSDDFLKKILPQDDK